MAVLLSLVILPGSSAVEAQEGSFSGELMIGYRNVDIGGQELKYREDLNLEDGPRLFGLRFELQPGEGLNRALDVLRFDLSGFGGEPFETLAVQAKKHGRFDFQYDRRRSEYFYQDQFLPPELVSIPLANGGDFHHFDFERVQDSALLTLTPSPELKVHVGFDRYQRHGESTTTLDISRDEFELERPLDETQEVITLGLEYAWSKATLVVQGRRREFDTGTEIFLPGRSLGEDPEDATTLDFFFLDQPYEAESDEVTARLVARPTQKLTVRGAAIFQSLDLDATSQESGQGTTFQGLPFITSVAGRGEIERDVDLLDLDLSYRLDSRWTLVGGVWRKQLDQEGLFELAAGGPPETNAGVWDIETTGAEAGAQLAVSPKLTVTAGVRSESRDVDSAAAGELAPGETLGEEESHDTEQTGAFVTVGWRPAKGARLTLDYEDTSYDDPFTLSSPTDGSRLRVRGRWALPKGWSLNASLMDRQSENSTSGWDADHVQADVRLAYHQGRFDLALGAGRVELDRSIDQTVVTLPGFGGGQELEFPIAYSAEADFFDVSARCRLTELWTLGGTGRPVRE